VSYQLLDAELRFLAWRDAQFAAISAQLEEAFPALLEDLSAQTARSSLVRIATSTFAQKKAAEEAVRRWAAQQLEQALIRAEAELEGAMLQVPGQLAIDSTLWDRVSAALPAMAGVGLIGASFAAIPAVISFATVSSTVLFFWSTSAISWPLLAIGAAGLGVATFTGSRSVELAHQKARAGLRARLHREAGRQVFALGLKPGTRCILNDIQAAVLRAGQNRLGGSADAVPA